jgi:hypothetical protein
MMNVEHKSLSSFSSSSMNSFKVICALYFDERSLLLEDELFLDEASSSLLFTLLGLTYFFSIADW